MTEKKNDDIWMAGLGIAGAALIGLIMSALGSKTNLNQGVNSYQSTTSYSPPANPGCGCSAGR